jgi:large conductance mechanosensitive channel
LETDFITREARLSTAAWPAAREIHCLPDQHPGSWRCGATAGMPHKEAPMLKEFREFALKGNVVDLAVGVIIGAAFGRIVESIVGDLFMPILGAIGGFDFTNYFLALSKSVTATNLADAQKQGAVIAYGRFITIAINFMIIAAVMFMVVKGMNRLKRQAEAAPAEPAPPPADVVLLTEIRDLLKK